ncbi:MAG: UPF0175 family protein [Ignavibacteriota bacterium]
MKVKTKNRILRVNTLKVKYPALLPDALNSTAEEFEKEAIMAMAVKLFEMKKVSSGVAASLAGIDRTTFLLSLKKYNVSFIDVVKTELLSDIENA